MSVQESKPIPLSHLSASGEAAMVDVSAKQVTAREAVASGVVTMKPAVLAALLSDALPKVDALATARVAGIMAAKRTSEWIPLCHPLGLDFVAIEFERVAPDALRILCRARTTARTGVEMEALTGVTAAALTLYDIAKSADKSMVIGSIRLEQKRGGRSGEYRRPTED
jgi:cyclic pyranopterin phosphate synthase